MIKCLVESYEQNKKNIRNELEELVNQRLKESSWIYIDYPEIVNILFNNLTIKTNYNKNVSFNVEKIVEINLGSYQGETVYVIPLDNWCNTITDLYYTHNYYGSCSGCDLLLSICDNLTQDGDNAEPIDDLMGLCLNLVQRTHSMKN